MAFELDHLFIWTEPGAPVAQKLIDFGLTEGPSNVHPGQGTANRRFFFHNVMLELLWVHDLAETRSALTAPTTLGDRFQQRSKTASSFGLCLRPSEPGKAEVPFSGRAYRPSYLPEPLSVWIGDNVTELVEPFLFYLSFGARPDAKPAGKRPPLDHGVGFQEITQITLNLPQSQQWSEAYWSKALQATAKIPGIVIKPGERELMEITLDGGRQGKTVDFGPELPLSFHW